MHYPNSSNKCNTLNKFNKESKSHSIILKIKENLESLDKFSFQSVTTDEVRK